MTKYSAVPLGAVLALSLASAASLACDLTNDDYQSLVNSDSHALQGETESQTFAQQFAALPSAVQTQICTVRDALKSFSVTDANPLPDILKTYKTNAEVSKYLSPEDKLKIDKKILVGLINHSVLV